MNRMSKKDILTKFKKIKKKKCSTIVNHLRGTAASQMTTDQILLLTRGEKNQDCRGDKK